jgi:hypothetical protein
MKEVWSSIKNFSYYKISNLGRVKSIDKPIQDSLGRKRIQKGRFIKQFGYEGNYYTVNMTDDEGIRRRKYVHRLLAETFLLNPENKPQVNHKDGNKFNNLLHNLEWVTIKENNIHAYEKGLKKSRKGEGHHNKKLTEKEVLEIISLKGICQKDIAAAYGITTSNVSQIINKKKWRHIWKTLN